MPLTDRMRVELALPARILHSVVASSLEDPEDPAGKEVVAILNTACMEPILDLQLKDRAKMARRINRVFNETLAPFADRGEKAGKQIVSVGKMGMIVYYLVEALIADGILVLYEGTPMAKALERVMPFLTELFEVEALDASAQKQGRRMLEHLRAQGYYRLAPKG